MAELRVSVCMAVHNGSRFLQPQVDSILSQLRPDDELVVVDDASTDASPAILEGVRDARLRLHSNEENQGVLRSFENALRRSSGELIFLSDHDDIWLPGKLAASLEVFASRPDVTMVVTDAKLIDENGSVTKESFFAERGHFAAGFLHNFLKNKYLGCTLSFRRSMLRYFLPIPRDVPMHDMWFGLLNAIYGKTFFIDEPLTAYRRHPGNATPLVTSGQVGKIIRWRWRLATNIGARVLRGAREAASGA
jgi:glycosyltransferase involved in cell wall biosynthesis